MRGPQSERTALLLTALEVEAKAVLRHLEIRQPFVEVNGTIFHVGHFGRIRVAVAEIGAGNAGAAAIAERGIQYFNPEVALFVGVAGGIKDVRIGDVVVSTKVYGYESGKDEYLGFKPRPDVFVTAHSIEQRALLLRHDESWKMRLREGTNEQRRLFVGPIAAGEKVVASKRGAIGQFLRANYSDALALEMEGKGFLEGVHLNHPVQGGVVRGISDLLAKKASADARGSQELASESAAAVAFELIASLMKVSITHKDTTAPDLEGLVHAVHIEPPNIPARSKPYRPPKCADRFIGRELQLLELIVRLKAGNSTVVVGHAGYGKTVLAAEAIARTINGAENLDISAFPDGIVTVDLFTHHGDADAAWSALAEEIMGSSFMSTKPGRERARAACDGRRVLIIVEGGEEANGNEGRTTKAEFLSVLSPVTRYLFLTRSSWGLNSSECIYLRDQLSPEEATELFNSLTKNKVSPKVSSRVLDMLAGHPLAITWAGNLLAHNDQSPQRLLDDWDAALLPSLSNPENSQETLHWLFQRSLDHVGSLAREILGVASARSPWGFRADYIHYAIDAQKPEDEMGVLEAIKSLVQHGFLQRFETRQPWDTAEQIPERWRFTHILGYKFACAAKLVTESMWERVATLNLDQIAYLLAADLQEPEIAQLILSIEDADALLRQDREHKLWKLLVQPFLRTYVDELFDRGYLSLASKLLLAVRTWLSATPVFEKPTFWEYQRVEVARLLTESSLARGETQMAEEQIDRAISICETELREHPKDEEWRDIYGLCLGAAGDIYKNSPDKSISFHRKSYEVYLELMTDIPSEANKRNFSVECESFSYVLAQKGQYTEALDLLWRALRVKHRQFKQYRHVILLWDDMSVLFSRFGEIRFMQQKWDLALRPFKVSLHLERETLKRAPFNNTYRRGLARTLDALAKVYYQLKRPKDALPYAMEGTAIYEDLAKIDPLVLTIRKELAASRKQLAFLREQLKRPAAD